MALKFDIEKLNSMIKKCENAKTDLEEKDKELSRNLETLREDWNTPAGDKFFRDLDDDWTKQVAQYTKITGAIIELLEAAIREYKPVEQQANDLKIMI